MIRDVVKNKIPLWKRAIVAMSDTLNLASKSSTLMLMQSLQLCVTSKITFIKTSTSCNY